MPRIDTRREVLHATRWAADIYWLTEPQEFALYSRIGSSSYPCDRVCVYWPGGRGSSLCYSFALREGVGSPDGWDGGLVDVRPYATFVSPEDALGYVLSSEQWIEPPVYDQPQPFRLHVPLF